jgi:NAD dependent epimerase/dehydratase family enzyme
VTRPIAALAGASGFIGTALRRALIEDGYDIRMIGRNGPDARWDDPDSVRRAVEGADLLVNLAGRSISCRFTDANRDEILRSRVDTTRALREAVEQAAAPPSVWFNASTATIYRYALDRAQTEADGEIGEGFTVDVSREWEREFFAGDLPRTRRIALRLGVVLGDGKATALLFRLARLGLGGPQYDGWWFPHRRYRGIGSDPTGNGAPEWHRSGGRQRFSWIHIDDVIGAIRFARDNQDVAGPINLVAPESVENRALMAALRHVVGMPVGLPAPRMALEPGMWVLRAEPELVLKSTWVAPERLLEAGFSFRFDDVELALRDVRATTAARRQSA